ncbi:MAG: uracil-DNA glycosylase family protein [Alphaproteobacteria bacterium]
MVGLAPGLHGANRTGRPFTGDAAGDLLYPALIAHGFMHGTFAAHRDDGLHASDGRVTNAARCAPPRNRPTGAEIGSCNRYLADEIQAMPRLAVILALGAVAHGAVLRALGERPAQIPFRHGARHDLARLVVIDSYHCSRLNTNTGRLTPAMFDRVVHIARAAVAARGYE